MFRASAGSLCVDWPHGGVRHGALGEKQGVGDTGADRPLSCAVTFSEGPYSKNKDPGSPEGEMGQASSFQPWDFMISQIKTAT